MSLNNGLSESKFFMWRACFAALHIDGKISGEEKKWAEEKLKLTFFSESQREILKSDLVTSQSLEAMFNKITDKVDRATFVTLFRQIGFVDKDFSTKEKDKFNQIEKAILSGLNLEEMNETIGEMEVEFYQDEMQKDKEKKPLERMVDYLVGDSKKL